MTSEVKGTIRGLGDLYPDGTERMEIHLPSDRTNGLPYSDGNRVPLELQINGDHYRAGLRATVSNPYIWISPDLKTKDGVSEKLAHVLTKAGFKKNDKIFLVIDGKNIVVMPASST